MKRFLFLLLIAFVGIFATKAQNLRFNSKGEFKVAQFTDIHWTPGIAESEVLVPQMIDKIVKTEHPDVLIFTGDIVTAKPAMDAWKSFAKMCEQWGIPYAVTMGNHDPEMTSQDSIFTFLQSQPLFIGEKGPKDLTGMGNYVLPVLASDGSNKANALLYCIDSNDYSPNQEKYGYYGWVEHNQIDWYRQQSENYTALNGGKPLPALAFFHIALPEFHMAVLENQWKAELAKAKKEGKPRPRTRPQSGYAPVNSGLFAAFIEKSDVIGAFAGHEHNKDHLLEYRGIALGYGRVSGYEANGKNERGGRIILLREGEYTFDSWITTPQGRETVYRYPQTLQESVADKELMPALNVAPSRKGVSYKYYTGKFKSVKDFASKGTLIEEGFIPNFTIEQARGRDHFGYDFSSYIQIPQDDVYHFSLVSDDGAQLFIDDKLVIDCDGSHSRSAVVAKVNLAKGFHKIQLLYFEDYMGESLGLWIESKTMRKSTIDNNLLYQTTMPGKQLRFNADGKFRIAQFTDLHLDPNTAESPKTLQMIQGVIQKENPDLVLLTGDIVTTGPSIKGWGMITEALEKAGKPYAVVFGNHDSEVTSRDTVFSYLEKSPLFIGERGIQLEKKMGNYILPVFASDGSDKEKALVYCFDSGEFGGDQERLGQYEWFDWEQINWYRKQSQSYTLKNGGKPLPSVAFFHIPTPEYRYLNGRDDVYGSVLNISGFGSPEINCGMFLSFLDMKDVMGTFVGHDHANDIIGQINGVALAYGRVSGYNASGKLERGGRIIELHEGQFTLDTWNVTPKGKEFIYHYPSGITSSDEKQLGYQPAKNFKLKKNGVKYTYYEGSFKSLEEVKTKGEKVAQGTMPYFTIDEAPAKDHYAYDFQSWINIPETAVYRFFINSDDGARLYIDGKLLIDNDGSHSAARKGAKIALNKGFHEIKIEYFEDYMGQELKVRILSKNMPEQLVPASMLFTK